MGVAKSSIMMLGGSVAAQAIGFAALPIITRLYDPSAVGLQALAITWATAITVIATLRLDLAVVLPESKAEAVEIAHVAMSSVVVVLLLASAFLGAASGLVLDLIGHPGAYFWVWCLPVLSLTMALVQLGVAFLLRERSFGRFSLVSLVNQGSTQAAAIVMASFTTWVGGLVVAKLIGQAAAVIALLPNNLWEVLRSWRPGRASYRRVFRESRQFVIFNAPYSLIGALALDAPLLIFGAMTSSTVVGLYGVARAVTFAVPALTSAALSSVYFREAVQHIRTPHLEGLARRFLRIGLYLPAAGFVMLLVWGPDLFVFVFGSEWSYAGSFAAALSLGMWSATQASWPGRVFEVTGTQRVQLFSEIVYDVVVFGSVAGSLLLWRDPLISVWIFSAITTVYYFVYFMLTARAAGFPRRSFAVEWLAGVAYFGLLAVLLELLRAATSGSGTGLWISAAIALLATVSAAGIVGAPWWRSRWRMSRAGE